MKRIDMHIHTIASDGVFTAEEAVNEAVNKQMNVIAISDHDSIGSVRRCFDLAKSENIRVIPAMEATTDYHGTEYHILGYGLNISDPRLTEYMDDTSRIRISRETEIVLQACELFDDVSMQDYLEFSKQTHAPGGFLSLNFLKEMGKVNDLNEFLALKRNMDLSGVRPFHPSEEVISLMKALGAVIVLAHPSYHFPGNVADNSLLDEFRTLGIDGIECYSPYNDNSDQIGYYRAYCERYALAVSSGSDCHGPYLTREMGTPYATDELCNIVRRIDETSAYPSL
ncbi:MAG: PHP domain-containing protein [Anaerofustis sp.]